MKLLLFPKGHRARQAAYLILISFLLLMVFYVIDDFLLGGEAVGFMFFILNVLVILSWIAALLGTIVGIYSIYKTKEFSFLLLALLFMGFTFSLFGLLDLFIK
ncbi:MAG TPA: hypothetical protein PLP48_01405 [Acholeplasmataceae bacterium]|jgi:hypothetical protein|nr:hypothetical protein [Acholeplasmataceae bacterium]